MTKRSLLSSVLILTIIVFGLYSFASAQTKDEEANISEITEQEIQQLIEEDESVTAQDLEVGEPRILPGHPLYFFKDIFRKVSEVTTFDPIKKLEKRQRWANERLMELKKLALLKKDPRILEKATQKYQQEIERIKTVADKIDENRLTERQRQRLKTFLDKLTHQQILHQKILERLEKQVPPQAFEKIKRARERHLERFAEVMNRLEKDPEKLRERLEKNLEGLRGSRFKELRSLEMLRRLEEKMPEERREAIQKARERLRKRLEKRLEKAPEKERERFLRYIEKFKKDPEEQLETIQRLRIDEKIPEIRKRILERVSRRIEKNAKKRGCPEWTPPVVGFCPGGKIVVPKDKNGCPLPAKCVKPAEQGLERAEKETACIALWDPVCGKDGKTYSNACWARVAGVEIDHKGPCEIRAPLKLKERVERRLQRNLSP